MKLWPQEPRIPPIRAATRESGLYIFCACREEIPIAALCGQIRFSPQSQNLPPPHEQTALDRQISATDSRIDRLVNELYGLTEEEIALVEGA